MTSELERLRQDGYVVAEDLLTPAEIDSVLAELEPHFGAEGWGRNEFEGLRNERV